MKFSQVIARLTNMHQAETFKGLKTTKPSERNAQALALAIEMLETAAAAALLPPPAPRIEIGTDMHQTIENLVKMVGAERASIFIPGAVQPEDLKPAKELEAELRERYKVSATRTGRNVFVEGKSGFAVLAPNERVPASAFVPDDKVYETSRPWTTQTSADYILVCTPQVRIYFSRDDAAKVRTLLQLHNEALARAETHAASLEAVNKELSHLNDALRQQNLQIEVVNKELLNEYAEHQRAERGRAADEMFGAHDVFRKTCTRDHNCWSGDSLNNAGPCNGLPRPPAAMGG